MNGEVEKNTLSNTRILITAPLLEYRRQPRLHEEIRENDLEESDDRYSSWNPLLVIGNVAMAALPRSSTTAAATPHHWQRRPTGSLSSSFPPPTPSDGSTINIRGGGRGLAQPSNNFSPSSRSIHGKNSQRRLRRAPWI
jgi:hypothetical protein